MGGVNGGLGGGGMGLRLREQEGKRKKGKTDAQSQKGEDRIHSVHSGPVRSTAEPDSEPRRNPSPPSRSSWLQTASDTTPLIKLYGPVS